VRQVAELSGQPGAAGSQLIPEVAQSLPAVSPDGRSYTFTIRPGFRFSPPSNDPVTAQTFKDTIERTLNPKMHSPVADEFADIPGYRDVHVYPLTPDPVKASQLAQGNGRTAVLYTCEQTTCEQDAQIVKTNLAAIGISVEVKTFPSNTLLARVATPGEPFDLAFTDGWEADYLDPLAMLTEMTENSSVSPPFDDPTYRHQLAAAAQLSGPQRYLAFGQLDIDVARDSAPLVAYGNQYSSDFFSSRMGCQTFGPYGIDLAALCTKSRAR
jgi:ABC-type transport system substrate-binding protein